MRLCGVCRQKFVFLNFVQKVCQKNKPGMKQRMRKIAILVLFIEFLIMSGQSIQSRHCFLDKQSPEIEILIVWRE